MVNKERFFIAQAEEVKIKNIYSLNPYDTCPPDGDDDDDEIEAYLDAIDEAFEEVLEYYGYDKEDAVDTDFDAETDTVKFAFLTGNNLLVAETPFRGYIIQQGEGLLPSDSFISQAQGEYGIEQGIFTKDSVHIIHQIIHNDAESSVDYHLMTYAVGKSVEIDSNDYLVAVANQPDDMFDEVWDDYDEGRDLGADPTEHKVIDNVVEFNP